MYIQTEKGTLLNLDKTDRIAIVNASENYLYDDFKIIASYGKKNYILATFDVQCTFVTAAAVIGIAIISSNTILFSSRSQLKGITTSVALWCMAMISI